MDKNFKIFGVRAGLIGDSIMALPILNYLENKYSNSYKIWVIEKKCSQAAPIYINHPLIDKILISSSKQILDDLSSSLPNVTDTNVAGY